jgi:hypothetical protein
MYSAGEWSYRMKAHVHEFSGNPRGSSFIRACTVDHGLTPALALLDTLEKCLKCNRSRNDSIALTACAGTRIDENHGRALLAKPKEFLDRDAAHAQLLKELVSPPGLKCQETNQESKN